MVTHVSTVAFQGIDALGVDVQVLVSSGSVMFTIVGLPDKAVSEARERVRAALASSGLSLPPKRITVNLAPADMPKEGSHFDLPIALGLMAAIGAIPKDALAGYTVLGELGLDGSLAGVNGVLPAALFAHAKGQGLICPQANGSEGAWATEHIDVLAPKTLTQLANHFKGSQVLNRPEPKIAAQAQNNLCLRDIRGQEHAKRALEITAAGGHNLLMSGPPGAGKSMLAQRLPGLLPALSAQELLEVSMIASMAGLIKEGALSNVRPFRSPHHSASMPALIGGGVHAKPGEVSLAHGGVLFLDELPEFSTQVLESLRQPLESGEAIIARANVKVRYPARFQLIAAMNPCRCGMATEPGFVCRKGQPANCMAQYKSKLSGPLLDRIDIHLDVPSVQVSDLFLPAGGESSAQVRERVCRARIMQGRRYGEYGLAQSITNAFAPTSLLDDIVNFDEEGRSFLTQGANSFKLSARGFHRVMRLARTLADLDESQKTFKKHVAEALAFRAPEPRLELGV